MSALFFCRVDLVKHHFSLHAVNDRGKIILHKSVSRAKLLTTLVKIPSIRIGIETCTGAYN